MSRDRKAWSPPLGATGLPNVDNFDYEETATRPTETNPAAPLSVRANASPTLSVVLGADAGRIIRITGAEVTIGRATNCDLVLPDPGVSRRHARVVKTSGGFAIEDLGSKNGTYVDGESVTQREIAYGEAFQVGPHVLLRLALMTPDEERLSRELYDSSMRDVLTHAYNRRYLVDRLSTEIAFAERHDTQLSLVLVDLDHFKSINDELGHAAGDDVLRETVRRIIATVRAEDVAARIGGEEFAIMLRGIGRAEAHSCAERVRVALASRGMRAAGERLVVTGSFGVASASECIAPVTPDKLLALADRRLYGAKRAGRNVVSSTNPT